MWREQIIKCKKFVKRFADKFSFRHSDTNKEEVKCTYRLLIFQGLYQDTNQLTKGLWYFFSLFRAGFLIRSLR